MQNGQFSFKLRILIGYTVIDLARDAEKCDPPVVGTHPVAPVLQRAKHHFSLPLQRH